MNHQYTRDTIIHFFYLVNIINLEGKTIPPSQYNITKNRRTTLSSKVTKTENTLGLQYTNQKTKPQQYYGNLFCPRICCSSLVRQADITCHPVWICTFPEKQIHDSPYQQPVNIRCFLHYKLCVPYTRFFLLQPMYICASSSCKLRIVR